MLWTFVGFEQVVLVNALVVPALVVLVVAPAIATGGHCGYRLPPS